MRVTVAVSLVVSLIILVVIDDSANLISAESFKRVQILNGSPYVQLQHGLYFGKTLNSNGKDVRQTYHAFLGIRYAATPKRYERSVPMTDSDTVALPLMAQSLGSTCPQITQNGSMFIGKEDCLVGNIYVPNKEPLDKDGFPVIVFVHPGSFKSGNGGAFDVSYFMSENVICATFNYRLGSLGFVNTAGASNLGLYDQVTFLEWINSNIASFGGNKRRITIAGVESGAASVKYLLLSHSTKGLFSSAIIHGGWMFLPHLTSYTTRQFYDELECPHRPSHLLVDCLRTKRLKDLMRSQKIISEKYFDFSTPFLPAALDETCDSHKVCQHSFFSKPPALLLSEHNYKRVPLLVGMNSADVILNNNIRESISTVPTPFYPEEELGTSSREMFTRWLDEVLQRIPGFQYENFGISSLMEIQQLYFAESMQNNRSRTSSSSNGGNSSSRVKAFHKDLTNFLYDIFVVFGLWKFAMTYAYDKPVYPYLITFLETRNHSISDRFSSAFADGIEFLTPSLPDYHEFETGSEEETFSRQLVHLWATFATHQKPVDIWQSKETWLPLSAAQLNGEKPLTWYALNKEVDIIPEPFSQRMKFWDRIFRQSGKH